MNIAPAHIDALQAFGYTDAEARFLYIVATHSGYFVARQFLAFTGSDRGKRTTTFWNKLATRRHARTETFPISGVVHHLFSQRLYRQIDKENLRNHRTHEIDFIKRRIAILDFVILNQGCEYLETEPDKIRFFCERLNVEKQYLPARLFHPGKKTSRPTIRFFLDRFPMFVVPSSPVVTFTYIHEGGLGFKEFASHLRAYLPLFRQLSEFRMVYVSRTSSCLPKATEIFHSLVKIPLESDISVDLVRYFRVRKAWDEKQYGAVSDADLIFRNLMRTRFSGERFEGLYRGWKNGRVTEIAIREEAGANDRERMVGFETFALEPNAVQDAHSEGFK
jgi:hypothetical protein